MGKQLVQFFAQGGYPVILCSRNEKGFIDAIDRIEKGLARIMDPQEIEAITSKIETTNDLTNLKSADLIIETIIEDMEIKKQLFNKLSDICPQNTFIATNTSSLPITELASSVLHPERFIGLHFFNPIRKMHLVEVVCGKDTSKRTIDFVTDLSKGLGKTPIVVRDSPGFIVNRLLMPLINEAAFLLQEGISPSDIDNAIKLGLNHPMGPLALADLIGLDVCESIMNTLYRGFNDARYTPAPIFHELVSKGHLGKKAGKGFYNYCL